MTRVLVAVRYGGAALAMALLQVWTDLLGHSSALQRQMDLIYAQDASTLPRYVGMLVGSVLFLALAERLHAHERVIVASVGLAGLAVTVACATAPASVAYYLLAISGFVHSVLSSYTILLVFRLSDVRAATIVVIAAFALKGCIPSLVEALPVGALPLICCVPALASAFYLVCDACGRVGEGAGADGDQAVRRGGIIRGDRTSLALLVVGVVASVICAVARNDTSMSYWGSQSRMVVQQPLAALIGAAVYVVMCSATFVRAPQGPIRRFVPSITVLLAAFALLRLDLLDEIGITTDYGAVLFEAYAEQYSHIFYIMAVLTCAYGVKMASVRVIGVLQTSFFAVYFVMACLGPYQSLSLGVILAACVALYVFVIATHGAYEQDLVDIITATSSQAGAGARAGEARRDNPLEAAVEALSFRFELSERERSVLSLLIQGRGRREIGEALGLAYGTVGSYSARIYEKLRVHSKQELLSLIYAEMDGQSGTPADAPSLPH